MTKKRPTIKTAPLLLSFLFFANPNIAIIDILPDFIGYISLCVALSKLADLNDSIDAAISIFRRMIFIDAGKWVAIFWIFGMTVPSEKNTSVLLWTFVFSVIELVFLLPAFSKLYKGLTQLGYLLPNSSIFNNGTRKGRIDKIKVFTLFFVIAKSVMCVLPEFSDLTNASYDENLGNGVVNLYNYIGLMRVMAFLPVLLIGLIWLICIFVYFVSVIKDREFISALESKYTSEILPKTGLFIKRDFRTFTMITTIALILTIDFRVEGQNIIPDVLSAVLFIIALSFLQRHNDIKKVSWILPSALFTAISALASLCEYRFFDRYYYSAIIRSEEARNAFIIMIIMNVLKAITLLTVIFAMHSSLIRKIKLHTGFVAGMENNDQSEIRMVEAIHTELKKGLWLANALAIVYVISDICYDLLSYRADFMGMINIGMALICIALYLKALYAIQTAIDTKYMFE